MATPEERREQDSPTNESPADSMWDFLINEDERVYAPGDWVRCLGHMESLFATNCYVNCNNTAQAIWVSTPEPLTEVIVKTALGHLVRRLPFLNMCVQFRWVRYWLKQMDRIVIDFEVDEEDPMTIFDKVLNEYYKMSVGPLWRARMVRLPSGITSPCGESAKNHAMIVFGVHHVITDSSTNMVICKEFVNILNNLVKSEEIPNRVINISECYAEYFTDDSIWKLVTYAASWLKEVYFSNFRRKITFDGLIPTGSNFEELKNKSLRHIFQTDESKVLFSKCKKNRTSVHAAVVTALNKAYYKIVNEKSSGRFKEVTIHLMDCINLRRFYGRNEDKILGCHISVHKTVAKVTMEDVNEFWNSSKKYRESLHEAVKSKKVLENLAAFKDGFVLAPFNRFRNWLKISNIMDSHYLTTSMGDVTTKLDGTKPDDPVQLTDMTRAVDINLMGWQALVLSVHTFRGRLHVYIDYTTNKISDGLAIEIFQELKTNIHRIIASEEEKMEPHEFENVI